MKILVAEDDFVSRTLLLEILNPYGTCHGASDGKEALDAFIKALDNDHPYELICLDIMMPIYSGQEVLKRIREIEAERGIGGFDIAKIIMVTALDDAKNIMKALIGGSCETYMVKPIHPEKLLAELKKLGLVEGE